MKPRHTIAILIGITLLVSCQSNKFKESEYTSMVVNASPGAETQVQMEDGAGINIPEESILEDVDILIERNPEKTESLPELPEGFVQASDFYNYQVIKGQLTGPVDLVMPFDESLKPDPEAELMVGFPVDGGWNFFPVTAVTNGKAVLYTDNLGDPIIGWRFSNWEKSKEKMEEFAERHSDWASCESSISIAAESITNAAGNWLKINVRYEDPNNNVQGVPFKISINNYIQGIHDNVIEGQTSSLGTYEKWFLYEELSAISGQAEEHARARNRTYWPNSFEVTADCMTIAGNPDLMPKGFLGAYYTYYYSMPILTVTPPTESPSVPVAQPPSTAQPAPAVPQEIIPPGAIQLPDFVGTPFDEAVDWLKQNGFKHMWVDGKSSYDVGVVYGQQPAAGKYKVPHRTTVMLYRTVEKVIDPCSGLDLTSEECINLGEHEYHVTTVVSISSGADPSKYCRMPWDEYRNLQISFSNGAVVFDGLWWMTLNGQPFTKTGVNTFVIEDPPWIFKLVFTSSGFTIEEMTKGLPNSCVWNHTFTMSP